jgi:CubicO group peptidase (beta-lactamase class C family)
VHLLQISSGGDFATNYDAAMTAAQRLLHAIDLLCEAVPATIPGAALGVITAHGERAIETFGLAQRDSWFDLASLTKVLFTTPAILRLAAAHRLDLDQPLATAIPDLRQYDMQAAERRITYRQCLGHQTHLPAVEPLYTYGQNPATLRAFILQRVWPAGPPVYSDINFMLLGIAIERLTGHPLADQPLPPGLTFHPPPEKSLPTEHCTWRGRIMRGEVHDENAFALGGAAGHAGLFGTIDGVLDAALALLRGKEPALAPVRERLSPIRTHGWEACHPGWAGGTACSQSAIGHTGFTGTGLWIDFEKNLAWSLLTNRVHPTRHRETGIHDLRRQIGTAIASQT